MYDIPVIVLQTIGLLLPIVNPLAVAPYFMMVSSHLDTKERRKLASNVFLYSIVLLIAILLIGKQILDMFGLPLSFIKLGGGITIVYAGLEMLYAAEDKTQNNKSTKKLSPSNIAFFPLTLPLTAGIGAITVMLMSVPDMSTMSNTDAIVQYISVIIGTTIWIGIVGLFYRYSDIIFIKILKRQGTLLVQKLSAFILFGVGLLVSWEGIVEIIETLKITIFYYT